MRQYAVRISTVADGKTSHTWCLIDASDKVRAVRSALEQAGSHCYSVLW